MCGDEGEVVVVVDAMVAALARVDQVERTVDGDAMQPGGEGGACVERVRGPIGAQKRLLHDVVRVGGVPGDAVRGPVDPARVPLDQHAKRVVVAAAYAFHEFVVGRV